MFGLRSEGRNASESSKERKLTTCSKEGRHEEETNQSLPLLHCRSYWPRLTARLIIPGGFLSDCLVAFSPGRL